MKYFEKIILYLLPTLRIKNKWKDIWHANERNSLVLTARIYFTFWMVTYVLHYFYIDLPLKKEPIELWAYYRFSLATLSAVSLLFTFTNTFKKSNLNYILILLSGFAFSYMQSQSMIWRSEVPYFYSVIVAVIPVITIRKTIFESTLYLTALYFIQINAWLHRKQELPYILSAAMVGYVFVNIVRSRKGYEVLSFINEQEQIETKVKLIETQKELNDQIRSFLPKVIYQRIIEMMHNEKKTILQSMDEVLRPKHKPVVCLYTDIRGYTLSTNVNNKFVKDAALPNMKMLTDIIENNGGIPRLIGDLIFSYFDYNNVTESIKRALICSYELSRTNQLFNQQQPEELRINRYLILSFGDALVGNIGGSEGSREITVLGKPANILSRIDLITKDKNISSFLNPNKLILSSLAHDLIIQTFKKISIQKISLSEMKVNIKDFPSEKYLGLLNLDFANYKFLVDEKNINELEILITDEIETIAS